MLLPLTAKSVTVAALRIQHEKLIVSYDSSAAAVGQMCSNAVLNRLLSLGVVMSCCVTSRRVCRRSPFLLDFGLVETPQPPGQNPIHLNINSHIHVVCALQKGPHCDLAKGARTLTRAHLLQTGATSGN